MNRHGEPDERDQERLAEYDHYLSGDPVACETCNGEGRVKVFKIDAVTQEYEHCPDCDGSGDTRAALEADPLLSVLADFLAGKGTMYVSDIRKKMPAIRASLADAGLLVTDEMAAVLAAAEAWVYPSYPLSVEDGHFLTHALIAAVDAWQAAKGGET